MRELIKDFVAVCSRLIEIPEPIYEFGALQVPGQEGFADLRGYFPKKKYIGADLQIGPGVDEILDLHDIKIAEDSIGAVLLLDTIEHVEYPRRAISEIHRVLRFDGILMMSSVMHFPIHEYPCDFWRFTPAGFRSLLKGFETVIIESVGRELFPHTVVAIGCKREMNEEKITEIKKAIKNWEKRWSLKPRSKGKRILKMILPPLSITLYRKIREKMG